MLLILLTAHFGSLGKNQGPVTQDVSNFKHFKTLNLLDNQFYRNIAHKFRTF